MQPYLLKHWILIFRYHLHYNTRCKDAQYDNFAAQFSVIYDWEYPKGIIRCWYYIKYMFICMQLATIAIILFSRLFCGDMGIWIRWNSHRHVVKHALKVSNREPKCIIQYIIYYISYMYNINFNFSQNYCYNKTFKKKNIKLV